MYILTDYRLILTKKTDPISRQRGQTLAGLRWRESAATVNYRPVLSSVRHKITNPQLSKENLKEKEKLAAGPTWEPDTRTDWPTDRRRKFNFNFIAA
jgi:hypothetical protein